MHDETPSEGTEVHEEGAAPVKAGLLERLLAKFIDLLVCGAVYAFPTVVGPLAAATYILVSDGLKGGRSLGKRVTGLKTVSAASGAPCDMKGSVLRNMEFSALIIWHLVVGWIPYVGKPLTVLAWGAVVALEIALIYNDERGARFGDRIAGTAVVPLSTGD
jgi:hypothetical protein